MRMHARGDVEMRRFTDFSHMFGGGSVCVCVYESMMSRQVRVLMF